MKKSSLLTRLLLAMLAIALLPLLISSAILAVNLRETGKDLAAKVAAAADLQASENLEMRARQVAGEVARYLADCETDLRLLARLPLTAETLQAFSASRRDSIWEPAAGHPAAKEGVRTSIARYRTITLTDSSGRVLLTVKNGRLLPPPIPENTGQDDVPEDGCFSIAKQLKPGDVHVSHLQGFHVGKEEQLRGAPSPEAAVGGKRYQGYIRFATPLFDTSGRFKGVLALSLDHRHLMEFTQHILPGAGGTTPFPSYQSGNYAFMFDDEGWIITHPKYWDIRGIDRATGRLVPPYTADTSTKDIESGRIPFNLDQAGFIHPSYPLAARLVREGKSGYLDTTNVGGARKIMAFAPILYGTGDYRRHGIFGGITIGFQVDQFHEPARSAATFIQGNLQEHLRESVLIIGITTLIVLLSAFALSGGITRPLALLTREARQLAKGDQVTALHIPAGGEIGELAESFNRMANELEQRKNSLLETMSELRSSRQEILAEKDFKENILESISSAILTFSPSGELTSVNGTGRRFLGGSPEAGTHFRDLFTDWGELSSRIEEALAGARSYGREPLIIGEAHTKRYYEMGLFPIGEKGCRGLTLTIRDETERERLREEMVRMDRLVSLGRISAGIAHEVRNPLTGISLLLDDLHDRLATDPENQALMEKALHEIERVERLVSSLLTYAAPPRTSLRQADLNRIVQDTLIFFRRSCENQGVTLLSHLEALPAIEVDVEKIRQALFNLLKNALEALGDGGTISISTRQTGNSACITVTDTGSGIPDDEIPLLFEPFYTRKSAGTGLGLSITQRIVDEHHGTIDVSRPAGGGSSFTISLPLQQQHGA